MGTHCSGQALPAPPCPWIVPPASARGKECFQPVTPQSRLRSPPQAAVPSSDLSGTQLGPSGSGSGGKRSPFRATPMGTCCCPTVGTHLGVEQLPSPPRRLRCRGKEGCTARSATGTGSVPAPQRPAVATTHRPGGAAGPPGSAGRAPGCHRHLCLPPPARDPGGRAAGGGIQRLPPHPGLLFSLPPKGTPKFTSHLSDGGRSHFQRSAEPRLVLGHLCKRGRCIGEHPREAPFSPKPLRVPPSCSADAGAGLGGVPPNPLPLRSALAGFPSCRRFLLLEVTNAFSSSAREMYCPTCPQRGVRGPPLRGQRMGGISPS